jgi:SSS family solute:Na+ symporter
MNPVGIWIAIAVYGVAGLAVALWARRQMAGGAEEFYLGGRRITGLVSAASYAATTYSAFMMLGLAGLTYRGGVGAFGFELIYFAGLGLVLIFGPRYWLVGRRFGFVTPSEMLGARYGSRLLAGLVAVLSCVFLIPYSAVQLMGIGLLLSGITNGAIPVGAGILVGAVIAATWTLMAGLRSVAWTDAVQSVLIMGSALLALWFVVDAIGGAGVFMGRIESEYGAWLHQPGPGLFSFATFVGLTLPWLFFSISNPQVSQRLFTTRDLGAMRTMILGFLCFGLVFTVISILWGYSALLLVPDLANPDLATPALLASGAIPAWLAIPLLIGIVAAAITTVDSIALTLASMVGRDVYRAGAPSASDAAELTVGKIVILVVIAAAALFASLQLDLISLLSVASSAGLLVTVPTIVGAFFWRRSTAAGALWSIAGGTIAVVGLGAAGINPMGIPYAVVAFALTVALFVGVSLVTRPPADRGKAFIDDVKPQLDELGAS